MESAVIVAIISFAGTLIGSAGGIIASSKLTNYRLEQLEKKMDSNSATLSKVPVLDAKIGEVNRRVARLECDNAKVYGYFDGC